MIKKNTWKIECHHTPETIDRILLPIRKRGLTVNTLSYEKNSDEQTASCTLEFDIEETEIDRVYKNMIRLQDIIAVHKA